MGPLHSHGPLKVEREGRRFSSEDAKMEEEAEAIRNINICSF